MEGVEPVDVRFESTDVSHLDPVLRRFDAGGHGELGLGDVELVLEPQEGRPERPRAESGSSASARPSWEPSSSKVP